MAIVHKVIILNTPFRLFGYSFVQWIFLLGGAAAGVWVWFSMPNIKIHGLPLQFLENVPVGLIFFVGIISAGGFIAHATLLKPWQWWLNRALYAAQMLPTEIFPKPQPAKTYFQETDKSASTTFLSQPTRKKNDTYN